MPTTLEVQYFNTFLLKKLQNVVSSNSGGGPTASAPYADVPALYQPITADDWYIEESRIRGGYNNTTVDFGVKAYLDETDPVQQHRFNTLIYSGIYNSRTGVNNTNQFSVGEDITKSVDPANGSIQKLYAEDTNLIIFQEDKVSRALIDKDAIYSAEGNAAVTSTNLVIGQIVPYAGEYGISTDPFSFAVYGYRKYFTDRKRGCVLRLSSAGEIIEISGYGMHDFFRDQLSSSSINKIIGGWDGHTKNYILSIQTSSSNFVGQTGGSITPVGNSVTLTLNAANTDVQAGMYIYRYTISGTIVGHLIGKVNSVISSGNPSSFNCDIIGQIAASETIAFSNQNYKTLSFDESVQGWTSFVSYKPNYINTLDNNLYTFLNGKVFTHYNDGANDANYCTFYGLTEDANVTVVLNSDPSVIKNFKTFNYEGNDGWKLSSFTASSGDSIFPIERYNLPSATSLNDLLALEANILSNNFKRKENKYFANLVNNSAITAGEVFKGQDSSGTKGFFSTAVITLEWNTSASEDINYYTKKKELFAVSSDIVESSY